MPPKAPIDGVDGEYVSGDNSASVAFSVTEIAGPSSVPEADTGNAVGVSLSADTVIVTVAELNRPARSEAVKAKVSVPTKSRLGVYVTDAVRFSFSTPLVGWAITKATGSFSGSGAMSENEIAVSSGVPTAELRATGGSLRSGSTTPSQFSSTALPWISGTPRLMAASASLQSTSDVHPSASPSTPTTDTTQLTPRDLAPSLAVYRTVCDPNAAVSVKLNVDPLLATVPSTVHVPVTASPSGSVGVTENDCDPPVGTTTVPSGGEPIAMFGASLASLTVSRA